MTQNQITATDGGTARDSSSDRRWDERRPCLRGAAITRPGSGVRIGCKIINMSTTGACLELTNEERDWQQQVQLPAYFTLSIPIDKTEIDCAIVWRNGQQVGIRFLAAPRDVKRLLESH